MKFVTLDTRRTFLSLRFISRRILSDFCCRPSNRYAGSCLYHLFLSLASTLAEYSRTRNPDAEAMCDLAMYNYIEVNVIFKVTGEALLVIWVVRICAWKGRVSLVILPSFFLVIG